MQENLMDRANHISDDPRDRVPQEMKELIDSPNTMFDIHCHVFNFDYVPDQFLGIRIPMTRRFLRRLVHFLQKLIPWTDTDPLSNIAYFINIGRSSSIQDISEKLFDYYPEGTTIFCPLMMDMRPGIKGEQKVDYNTQIDNMRNLRNQYPDKLLPFVAIDPNNCDCENIFLRAFTAEYNFFGIKIYPSLGYLPSNPKLMKIYEVCEAKKIPVTVHCGGGTVHSSYHRIEDITGKRLDENNNWVDSTESKWFFGSNSYANYFNHPKNWEPVLISFPKLKLNLAHFGSDNEWERLLKGKSNTWVNRIMDLIARYDNVYADFSYNISDHKIFGILKERIEDNVLIAERTLYGSDYYMVVIEGHFRSIKTDFVTSMGDEIMNQIAFVNPKRFLFG